MAPIISPPKLAAGKRMIAAGRTGSGKSSWACYMLFHSENTWVILNPKHTDAYAGLPDSVVVNGLDVKKVEKEMARHKFVVVNPLSREATPDTLDDFIMYFHENWKGVALCCDELYSVHKSGRAGQGLISWLTRGRELKQTFLGLTQRPAWLSQFLFSESDWIVGLALNLEKDRERMVEMTCQAAFLRRIPPYHWLSYGVEKEELQYFGPVPLVKKRK